MRSRPEYRSSRPERPCGFASKMCRFVLFASAAWLLFAGFGRSSRLHAQVAPGPAMTNVRQIQAGFKLDIGDICVLEPGDYDAKTRVLAPRRSERGKAAKTATIEVDYDGFTPEARKAFQRAVDIWETHINSPVTIRVEAFFEELGENTLGSAGPTNIFIGPMDGEESIYGNALADALTGEDQTPGDPDIVARFSSDANWYYGPPPPIGSGPAADEIDFTSVVLHELGHGLGFFGSMTVDKNTGEGSWDYSDAVADQGGDPTPWIDVPNIYDRFAVEGHNPEVKLIDTYSNRSVALAGALQSNNVFYSGDSTNVAAEFEAGPIPPQLWLPPEWESGSSYSHLDEFAYNTGDPNSLMTPRIGRNEIVHSPGPVVCGMFADMGWSLGPGCHMEIAALVVDALEREAARLTWTETWRATVERYVIEGRYFDGPFQEVDSLQSRGSGPHEITIPREELVAMRGTTPNERDLPIAGQYTFRLRMIRPNGEERISETIETTIDLGEAAVVSAVYPNPFAERASVSLTLQSRQRVRVEVYNAAGQHVGVIYDRTHPANDPRPVTFDATRFRDIASGRYFFRVVGQDFTETRSAVFVR